MTLKLFDVVIPSQPIDGIPADSICTVVDVYKDGEVEVEFCTPGGVTIEIRPVLSTQIKAIPKIKKAA